MTHTVNFDENKRLVDQDLMDETKIILSMIYKEYINENGGEKNEC